MSEIIDLVTSTDSSMEVLEVDSSEYLGSREQTVDTSSSNKEPETPEISKQVKVVNGSDSKSKGLDVSLSLEKQNGLSKKEIDKTIGRSPKVPSCLQKVKEFLEQQELQSKQEEEESIPEHEWTLEEEPIVIAQQVCEVSDSSVKSEPLSSLEPPSQDQVIIKLCGDKPLVWTAKDWMKLQENRIHGNLVGTPANFPRQTAENALPMLLLDEEVTLILEKKIGKIYNYKKSYRFPNDNIKKQFKEYLETTKEQQKHHYEELCEKQVKERIDSIIEGKKRKRMRMSEEQELPIIDREAEIQIQVERKVKAATSTHLIQIPTASPWLTINDIEEAKWTFPKSPKEKLRYRVFKDLWEKGYTLTTCSKFGGDFLVYPGESRRFHAYFIVICIDIDEPIRLKYLVEQGRLSVFTRKNMVLASVDDDGLVFYNTLSWPGKLS